MTVPPRPRQTFSQLRIPIGLTDRVLQLGLVVLASVGVGLAVIVSTYYVDNVKLLVGLIGGLAFVLLTMRWPEFGILCLRSPPERPGSPGLVACPAPRSHQPPNLRRHALAAVGPGVPARHNSTGLCALWFTAHAAFVSIHWCFPSFCSECHPDTRCQPQHRIAHSQGAEFCG